MRHAPTTYSKPAVPLGRSAGLCGGHSCPAEVLLTALGAIAASVVSEHNDNTMMRLCSNYGLFIREQNDKSVNNQYVRRLVRSSVPFEPIGYARVVSKPTQNGKNSTCRFYSTNISSFLFLKMI